MTELVQDNNHHIFSFLSHSLLWTWSFVIDYGAHVIILILLYTTQKPAGLQITRTSSPFTYGIATDSEYLLLERIAIPKAISIFIIVQTGQNAFSKKVRFHKLQASLASLPQAQAQIHLRTHPSLMQRHVDSKKSRLFDHDRFRFTPEATSKKPTRLWDRRPTTPVLPRSKTQKIWKRCTDSTSLEVNSMHDTDTFSTEINLAATLAALRGVKRLRLAHTPECERGRSFLETKWEAQTEDRRRKYVAPAESAQTTASVDFLLRANGGTEGVEVSDEEQVHCSSSYNEPRDIPQPEETAPEVRTMPGEVNQEKSSTVHTECQPDDSREPEEETFFDAVAEPMAVMPEQGDIPLQASPVRKIAILDGDDAEIISDFLSKARAKRAANTPVKKDASVDRLLESPTPSARRILEVVDGNSPRSHRRHLSPEKLQPPDFYFNRRSPRIVASKSTDQKPFENVWDGSIAPSSPVVEVTIEHARYPPRVPDQIPTRRRKGTEFVFMQRTDDQQTALLTKANTRLNKGSKPPHKLLPILNKAIAALGTDLEDGQHRHRDLSKKQVRWNDAALVEYCGEKKIPEFDLEVYQNSEAIERNLRSSSRRNNNTSKNEEHPPEATESYKQEDQPAPFLAPIVKMPAPANPYRSTPMPRKMRKLVGAKHLDVHPNEGESPPVTRINLSMKTAGVFPGTPLRHKKTFSLAQGVPRTLSLKPTKSTTSTSSASMTSGSGSGSGLGSGISYPTVLLRKQTKS
ncbi:hypothetical protein H112_01655 [Trichophyton rubrum D6]|uniref:Uncharacterized protein n=2 Tax=Trichophyton TaxID=5550 RepID=A0A022WCR5_TRIRU|nr:hypothetical protein H100_01651 [Trichophyton rubrum MR850]EZF45243.1 hypothetical protein H102_01643 [Trichophyton rubrum CBS 100081]EZF55893.1 hypothetical protein H103_01657 [Trichophyton rubrum CBS 288.86]EZF66510.1 hypothetical protein H104_01632 [Trichophyton rubrum CBS 289.86]EZF77152.1 hypothetical protein H105_01659 [Trichophyton soudanense CBS 452.61]EZF87771.1 hypothetical protein H110_01655 [Trichophyton rubrum MR1448]EZG09538.1 hypothetical protein H106_01422 [Trichophyton rub